MLFAKLIETPWLSRFNYLSMVASKAARVVAAARTGGRERPVIEFGQRRTHHEAAVDAAYAAYLAGCQASSNVAATLRYGIPSVGTMDHFAVQAAEKPGVPVETTEGEFYADFARLFPTAATLLVDTYDTDRGLRDAVRATAGRVTGVRIDSNVTPESIAHARKVLDGLGAQHVKIYVSDGLDEHKVRELAVVADGFGVGENISCSPDAATGVGAVAKLVVNGYGKVTMKLAKGTGKATLPGELQAWRAQDHDLLALAGEAGPPGATPLLEPVWRGRAKVRELPPVSETRAYVKRQIAALPEAARALEPAPEPRRKIVASDALVALISKLTEQAGI
jgi:nicotinate phosphoribosyltransferase